MITWKRKLTSFLYCAGIAYWTEIEFGPSSHNLHLVAQLTSPLLVPSSTRSSTHTNGGSSSCLCDSITWSGESLAKFLRCSSLSPKVSTCNSSLRCYIFSSKQWGSLSVNLLRRSSDVARTPLHLLHSSLISVTRDRFYSQILSSLPSLKSPDHQLLPLGKRPVITFKRSSRVLLFPWWFTNLCLVCCRWWMICSILPVYCSTLVRFFNFEFTWNGSISLCVGLYHVVS